MKRDEFLYLVDKIDMVDGRLDDMEKLFSMQQQSLEYHIKRTDIAEKSLVTFQEELKQIVKLVNGFAFVGKVLGGVGGFVAFVLVCLQIYKTFVP